MIADILHTPPDEPFDYRGYIEEKLRGRPVVALMGHEQIPLEVLRAMNVFVLPLVFTGSEALTNEGGIHVTMSFCSYARNVMGGFMEESSIPARFSNDIDVFLRSNYCNGDWCTLEHVGDLLGRPVVDLSIPFIKNDASFKFFKHGISKIMEDLIRVLGTSSPSPGEIIRQVRIHDECRLALGRIRVAGVFGDELLRRYQEATVLEPGDMLARLEALYPALMAKNGTSAKSVAREAGSTAEAGIPDDTQEFSDACPPSPRLMLTGNSIFIGDSFGAWIEDLGANIVYYDTWIGGRMEMPIEAEPGQAGEDTGEDPIAWLARRYLDTRGFERMVPGSVERQVARLLNLAREFKIDGIINHGIKFCDTFAIDRHELKDRIGGKIPFLDIERDYSGAGREAIRTRIEAFLEMVGESIVITKEGQACSS